MLKLKGKQFGRLIVIKRVGKNTWGQYEWLCLCNCGKKKIILGSRLQNRTTNSCGCLQIENTTISNINRTQHGHTQNKKMSKTYQTWINIIRRCNNPKDTSYNRYGNRGITVCKRWLKSFKNFLIDMGECPKRHSIDRIDNNKGYYKDNCKWATPKQQARNRRNNNMLTLRGKTKCMTSWAEEYKINISTLWSRIYELDWSIEKALTIPIKTGGK